ncbi:MAG: Fic family protein [Candidatus Dojkabacteria bacterium]|nr:MAG: Fic family protein [Candidatus Dojkabacteria bacterium]
MRKISYINEADLEFIFQYIKEILDSPDNPAIDYGADQEGFKRLNGVLQLAKNNDYYPTIYDKAGYLFTAIIKGHYFSNGNKRLGIMITFWFFFKNKYFFKLDKINNHVQILKAFMGIEEIESDKRLNVPYLVALYNLALLIAGLGEVQSFQVYKDICSSFFQSTIKPEES